MYIWTQRSEMINIKYYPRVSVSIHDERSYSLFAYSSNYDEGRGRGVRIAEFERKVDADYLQCHLLLALSKNEHLWIPSKVKPLSVLWKKVQNELKQECPNRVIPFVDDAVLGVSEFDEFTITYELKWERELGSLLKDIQITVAETLKAALKEEYRAIDVKWECSE